MSFMIVAVSSFAIGVLVGATSIGGFLLVPLLALVMRVLPSEAVGTALVAMVPSSVLGVWIYGRRGQVDSVLGVGLAAFSLPGIFLGAYLAKIITEQQAVVSLAVLLIVIGAYIAWQCRYLSQPQPASLAANVRGGTSTSASMADAKVTTRWLWATPLRALSLLIAATLAGISAVLAGVGGALILVPVLVSLGVQPSKGIGTGHLLTLLIASAGVVSYMTTGRLDSSLVFWVSVLYSVGVILGAGLVRYINNSYLRALVSALCFVSAALLLVLKQ